MSETIVQKKLSKLILNEVGNILSIREKYISNGLITASVVRVTRDLSLAKIYVSVFPDSKLRETVDLLNEKSWEVRYQLAAKIKNKVRKIPELRFYEDDSFKEAERINKLLDKIKQDDAVDVEKRKDGEDELLGQ